MAKGNKKGVDLGNKSAQTAADTGSALNSRAMSLQDTLEPQLEHDIQAPTGFAPGDLAAMNTAAQEGAGGATSGAVGAMGAQAARTRNRGAFTAAADESARSGQRQAAQSGVEIQGANAGLKEQQRASALRAKQGLFGSDLSGSLSAMGLVPGDINAATKSEGPGLMDWMSMLGGLGMKAAGLPQFGGGGGGASAGGDGV